MKPPISHLNDPDMQAAPAALMRAAERAKQLAEQTGTPWVVRAAPPKETVPTKDTNRPIRKETSRT